MAEYSGLKVTVVGLGRSGKAMVSWLRKRGARVSVSDSRPESAFADWLGSEGSGLERAEFGGNSASLLSSSDLIVVSPGVPPSSPALQEASRHGVRVVGDLEVALEGCPAAVAAVSGTNGKSTTTALLGHLLKSAGRECVVAGNIGIPVGSVVDGLTAKHVLVLEVSSFQLDTAPSFHPRVALLLNVTPDHLDRYASFEEYAQSKARLFARQGPADLAVLNHRDARSVTMAAGLKARVSWFDAHERADAPMPAGAGIRHGWIVLRGGSGEERVMRAEELTIRGAHNLENALAACVAAAELGVGPAALASGLRTFPGIPHRLEPAGRVGGVEFVNDSKGTNVDAMEKALRSFPHQVVLIAGGRDKGADFGGVAALVREKVKAAVLLGEAADRIEEAWKGAVPVIRVAGMGEAVRRGLELAGGSGTVLLSPACASFDQFRDFEHRGEVFKEEVRRLGGGKA